MHESLVKVNQVAGTPCARQWAHGTASAKRHGANVVGGRKTCRNGRHGMSGDERPR